MKFAGDVLAIGREVMREEASAVVAAAEALDCQFIDAVNVLLNCVGRVVVTGIGKSGHIGHKIAATLASTGTPAFFVHAAEAGHGDLGMITSHDVLIALSNGGETDEVINVVSFAKRFGAVVVGISGNPTSRLGKLSDLHINSSISKEACPLGIAPTSSTLVQLSLGDALAMAVLARRGFTKEDFARTHPMGSLGRRYYLRVCDVMRPIAELPHKTPSTPLIEAIPDMAAGRMGAMLVLEGNVLQGIFTDSDLRRIISESNGDFDEKLHQPIGNFMTRSPQIIAAGQLASDALRVFEEKRISRIVCMDQGVPVGLLAWHDLLAFKVA